MKHFILFGSAFLTFINVVSGHGLQCYKCDFQPSDLPCLTEVEKCTGNQTCFTSQASAANTSLKSSRGCLDVDQCNTDVSMEIVGIMHSVVYTCCNAALCNGSRILQVSALSGFTMMTVWLLTLKGT
nr:PREDICTED: prostate stem cell antigen-like [Latimeria chalumnae]|eukprot:XP_005994334.1 PREDICTED: prostate stem cell antigen-like [Latimeria chalumnae]